MQQSKLGYPYDYGDELTPEMAQSNRNIILTILLLIWVLRICQVEAADGFPVIANRPRGRQNSNQCRNYRVLSKAATSAYIHHNDNGNDSYYETLLNSTFEKKTTPKEIWTC